MIIEVIHQKLIEVMLVNVVKKPKPLYNVCPKTMLLGILQQTLSIHQVQLLTSLEQTKNYKSTHRHRKTEKKTRRGNVVLNSLHGPTKQFTTYHPQYTTATRHTATAVLSQGNLDVKQFQNILCRWIYDCLLQYATRTKVCAIHI